ncbi:MAG: hypothetical protein H8E44_06830 [Planctomycetes bacterium]|nr:hypothetical protein [Planctomycetota bacterium]MBL7043007.1 hypothetical protein [Pirellulaceae bacterium]
MRVFRTCLTFIAGVAVVLTTTSDARTETIKLETKRLPSSYMAVGSSKDAAFRSRYYQSFYSRAGSDVRIAGQTSFTKVVVKEPKYTSARPFKAVAKLGTLDFGFAFDSDAAEADQPKSTSRTSTRVLYTRLYFDSNHNGDLTDDPIIETERKSSSSSYFPRVDVNVDIDGTKTEYSFYMRAYSSSSGYSRAYLYGAAYRQGEITLNGEKKRVVLVDSNSNAQFDDPVSTVTRSDGTVYASSSSDMIFIDPDPSKGTMQDVQQPVGKLLNIAGRFYDMELSPAGDKLTLAPSTVPVGYVSNPNKGVNALVHGDQGVLRFSADDSGKSPLPVGDWKLLSYTIDGTAKAKTEEGSLLDSLSAALVQSSSSARTYISARAKKDYTAVSVREGETVDLPFGPPYKPIVKVSGTSGSSGNRAARLSLSFVGTGGEICSGIMVNGSRPKEPEFTITSAEEKVAQGKFRYG